MPLTTLGWREWLTLPDLGIALIRAKHTPATVATSLDVLSHDTFHRDGVEFVRFVVDTGVAGAEAVPAEAPVLDRRHVTDSGGHRTERIFIRTRVRLAGAEWTAVVNLAHRSPMLFPMLLGRTALAGRFVVDPAASFVFGDQGDP